MWSIKTENLGYLETWLEHQHHKPLKHHAQDMEISKRPRGLNKITETMAVAHTLQSQGQ
jgi:hypothetical protein